MASTCTLIETLREHVPALLESIAATKEAESLAAAERLKAESTSLHDQITSRKKEPSGGSASKDASLFGGEAGEEVKKAKKDNRTKAQKRRDADRDKRAYGWDWVDVAAHLSKTGP